MALALEVLILLLLLTLGTSDAGREQRGPTLTTIDASPPAQEPVEDPEPEPAPSDPEPQPSAAQPQPTLPEPNLSVDPAPSPPAIVPLRPQQPAPAVTASPSPQQPGAAPQTVLGPVQGPPVGPADRGAGADTEIVGTAPNGEPLYAAAWYRRPYPDELRGYLSTASGPGWGLIACRTVAEYRVEDCVALEESPRGSNISRSVLAASWQFRVRPPRVGGRSLVGTWVRIRIDYDLRSR